MKSEFSSAKTQTDCSGQTKLLSSARSFHVILNTPTVTISFR
jgi:hypothetical protein